MPGTPVGRQGEPGYAGLMTFCKVPLVLDPAALRGVDVAIVGAPIDETVTNRPGARFGPRAIRQADVGGGPHRPNMDVGVDPFEVLTVVDYGDAPVKPGDQARSHEAIRSTVAEICAAGAIPIVLGGDHSIAHPDAGAVAAHLKPETLGVIHFDAHADNAESLYGVTRSHGTPMRLLVEEGSVRGEHIVQIGLRGYWPDPEEFEWSRSRGLRWHLMDEISKRGMDAVLEDVIREAGRADHSFLSFDIDVCDPAFAPGTGTPEPGGITAREALRSVRRLAYEVGFAGMEVVEVSPPYDHAETTAFLANRIILEALSGLALRKLGREPRPERSP
ncbi:MAG TPA: agmatinase [Actinomycetota bacterium]|nr:agmatinase [Actinomycetota bacterium]